MFCCIFLTTARPILSKLGAERYWAVFLLNISNRTRHRRRRIIVATGIFFSDQSKEPGWIQFLDFQTRSIRKICPFGVLQLGPRPIAASFDGSLLVFVQRDRFNEDIVLLEGLE